MLSHPLTNFEIQAYYESEPKFIVYSRNNLPKTMKDGSYIVNLDECTSLGTHWLGLYASGNSVTYFDSFGVEHIPEETKGFIGSKNTITYIFRIIGL